MKIFFAINMCMNGPFVLVDVDHESITTAQYMLMYTFNITWTQTGYYQVSSKLHIQGILLCPLNGYQV